MNTALLKKINLDCQANVGYGAAPEQETISTGFPQLDAAIGGGIPKGRIVEISGEAASGKTALALHFAQQLPGPTLYVDADGNLSPYILNGQDAYLLNVPTLEETLDACQIAIRSGGFGAVVIDTVTALPTYIDIQESINSKYAVRNTQSRIISKSLPQFLSPLRRTGCTLILVNQLREKQGIVCGDRAYSAGGRAIGYYAALRLRTINTGFLKDGWEVTGQNVRVTVQKSKYAPPGRSAKIQLIYGEGLQP